MSSFRPTHLSLSPPHWGVSDRCKGGGWNRIISTIAFYIIIIWYIHIYNHIYSNHSIAKISKVSAQIPETKIRKGIRGASFDVRLVRLSCCLVNFCSNTVLCSKKFHALLSLGEHTTCIADWSDWSDWSDQLMLDGFITSICGISKVILLTQNVLVSIGFQQAAKHRLNIPGN